GRASWRRRGRRGRSDHPGVASGLRRRGRPSDGAPTVDSLARPYVAASEAGDSAAAAALRTRLGAELSADEIAALRRQTARLRQANAALEGEIEALRERSAFRQAFAVVVAEVGLGVG